MLTGPVGVRAAVFGEEVGDGVTERKQAGEGAPASWPPTRSSGGDGAVGPGGGVVPRSSSGSRRGEDGEASNGVEATMAGRCWRRRAASGNADAEVGSGAPGSEPDLDGLRGREGGEGIVGGSGVRGDGD